MHLRVLAPAQSRAALMQKLDVSPIHAEQLAQSAVVVTVQTSAPPAAPQPRPSQPLLSPSLVQIFTLGLPPALHNREAAHG